MIDPLTLEVRYIGRTKNSLKRRLSDHISDSKSNHNSYKKNWINSLKKLNKSPIIELIETLDCSWEESYIVEQRYISDYFKRGCNLVNLIDKGCGTYGIKIERPFLRKPILQYDLEGNFLKEWDSMTTVEKNLNINKKLIFKALTGISIKTGSYMWKYKTHLNIKNRILSYYELKGSKKRVKVIQYSKEGNFIKIFDSITIAGKELNIKSPCNISEAIKNKYLLYGYQWRYYTEDYTTKISSYRKIGNKSRKVILENNDKTQLEFSSMEEASQFLNISTYLLKEYCKREICVNDYKIKIN